MVKREGYIENVRRAVHRQPTHFPTQCRGARAPLVRGIRRGRAPRNCGQYGHMVW